jgi:hypothetical protein
MEYESPVRHDSMTYTIPIHTTKHLEVVYSTTVSGSNTTPPLDSMECMTYIADMATLYEEYSKKWFNRAVMSIVFAKNVAHEWDYMSHSPYNGPPRYENSPIEVYQIWCPESISLKMNNYTIHWKLVTNKYTEQQPVEVPSGELALKPKSEEVPYGSNQVLMVLKRTSRSEYHRKIRKARVMVAVSNSRLQKLILKYTERYGELGNVSDSDSVLSFDSTDN